MSDRFSRRGGGRSRQDEVGRTIYERADQLLKNRWRYLNPFDVVKDYKTELYRYAMRESEWEAWQLLENNKRFRNAMNYTRGLFITNPEGGFHITLRGEREEFIHMPIEWVNLPSELQERIHHWLIRSEAYHWEYRTIRDRIKALTLLCTTPGQIERVWPELFGFMPGHVIDKRFAKKALSPYPDGVWEDGWGFLHPRERELKVEFRPETLAWFNDALTEALILPLQDWSGCLPFPEVTATE